jgi:hypothetical protein
MLSTGSLTSSPTSLFWLTLGILFLTIVLIVVGIVTWRTTTPRKKILLTIASRSQILSAPDSMRDDLRIKYKENPVQGDLYVTAIELTNAGRAPIKPSDFDSGRSLRFALDSRIIKHLSTEHLPKSAPTPEITADENQFSLTPELITKGEVIKLALLTEGRPTWVETAFSPFGEVRIEIDDREVAASKRARTVRAMTVALPIILAAMIIFETVLVVKEGNQSDNLESNIFTFEECGALVDDSVTTISVLQILQQQAPVIENSTTAKSALIRSYDNLLTLAQSELDSISNEYQTISVFGISLGPAADMTSFTEKASNTLGQAAKSANKNISSVANQLTPISAKLASGSAIPSGCRPKQSLH